MKRFQSILCATVLTLAMTSTALAGNISTIAKPGNISTIQKAGNISTFASELYEALLNLLIP